MRKNEIKICTLALVSFIFTFFFCIEESFAASITIDTGKNKIYQDISVDEILQDVNNDNENAKKVYEGNYYVLRGIVESISKKGDIVSLKGKDNQDTLKCTCKGDLKEDSKKYHPDDSIAIFGKVTYGVRGKISFTVEKLTEPQRPIKPDTFYSMVDGEISDISMTDMIDRSLKDGKINYKIPSRWKQVEKNIEENNLGEIEGYQYRLNDLPGTKHPKDPESFFICYFNNERISSADDVDKTKAIEQTIINNISGRVLNKGKFKRNVKTYYGAKYDYYIGNFTGPLQRYHTEYIFQKDGTDGIIVYLYVYDQYKDHLSDIMFVTRFLDLG